MAGEVVGWLVQSRLDLSLVLLFSPSSPSEEPLLSGTSGFPDGVVATGEELNEWGGSYPCCVLCSSLGGKRCMFMSVTCLWCFVLAAELFGSSSSDFPSGFEVPSSCEPISICGGVWNFAQ